MNKIFEKIEKICEKDKYEIGYASLSGFLDTRFKQYKSGIALLRKLDDDIIDEIKNGPTKKYAELYHNINCELDKNTNEIANLLKSTGIDALAMKATADDSTLEADYKTTLRYFYSHKMTATRAGLGWIGKTDLFISRRFGPRVRLASVLTKKSLSETGIPILESQCGSCNTCVVKCPAQAATGKLWNIKVDRNDFYDPFKCRQYCKKISAEKIKQDISLCGICIAVCPIGIKQKNN